MVVRKVALCAAMSSLIFMSSTAAASDGCWYPDEIQAAQLTELETKLMVDTLKCRRQMPWLEDDYDAFEARHGEFLKTQYPIVIGRFMREDDGTAGGWRSAYDRYRTATANMYSGEPAAPEAGRCARAASLARVSQRVSGDELRLLAESIADVRPPEACGPNGPGFTPRPVPWAPRGVAISQAPDRELPPRAAVAAATVPQGMGAPPPVATPAAAPQVSSSEALAAAVVALQAATAALQVAAAAQPK